MKILISIALALILSGCMTYDVALKNKSGEIYTCKGYGFGVIGTPVAYANKADCIERAEQKGYKQ